MAAISTLLYLLMVLFSCPLRAEAVDLCQVVLVQLQNAKSIVEISEAFQAALAQSFHQFDPAISHSQFVQKCSDIKIVSKAKDLTVVVQAFGKLAESFLSSSFKTELPRDFLVTTFNSALSLKDLEVMAEALRSSEVTRIRHLQQRLLDQNELFHIHKSLDEESGGRRPKKHRQETPLKVETSSMTFEISVLPEFEGIRFNGEREWTVKDNMPTLLDPKQRVTAQAELRAAQMLSQEGESFLGVGDINPVLFPELYRRDKYVKAADLVSVSSSSGGSRKVRVREVKTRLNLKEFNAAMKQIQSTLLRLKTLDPTISVDTCELLVADDQKNREMLHSSFNSVPVTGQKDTFRIIYRDGVESIYAFGEEIPYTIRFFK